MVVVVRGEEEDEEKVLESLRTKGRGKMCDEHGKSKQSNGGSSGRLVSSKRCGKGSCKSFWICLDQNTFFTLEFETFDVVSHREKVFAVQVQKPRRRERVRQS
jgi:hypothetical protein